jgi:hypothetical protein
MGMVLVLLGTVLAIWTLSTAAKTSPPEADRVVPTSNGLTLSELANLGLRQSLASRKRPRRVFRQKPR